MLIQHVTAGRSFANKNISLIVNCDLPISSQKKKIKMTVLMETKTLHDGWHPELFPVSTWWRQINREAELFKLTVTSKEQLPVFAYLEQRFLTRFPAQTHSEKPKIPSFLTLFFGTFFRGTAVRHRQQLTSPWTEYESGRTFIER